MDAPSFLRPLCYLFAALALALSSCKKDDPTEAANEAQKQKDENAIKAYVTAQNLSATRTASGLYYVVETPGTGARPTAGQNVTVHYRGYLMNGTANGNLFDSSYTNGVPLNFRLGAGQVIKGWDEGVALMQKGETARLIIPSHLAYGPSSTGSIPANSVLIFYVKLVNIQ